MCEWIKVINRTYRWHYQLVLKWNWLTFLNLSAYNKLTKYQICSKVILWDLWSLDVFHHLLCLLEFSSQVFGLSHLRGQCFVQFFEWKLLIRKNHLPILTFRHLSLFRWQIVEWLLGRMVLPFSCRWCNWLWIGRFWNDLDLLLLGILLGLFCLFLLFKSLDFILSILLCSSFLSIIFCLNLLLFFLQGI